MFLYRTAELFTDTRQNMVFTGISSHRSGSTRSLNSFVGRPDKPKSGLREVECISEKGISKSYSLRFVVKSRLPVCLTSLREILPQLKK